MSLLQDHPSILHVTVIFLMLPCACSPATAHFSLLFASLLQHFPLAVVDANTTDLPINWQDLPLLLQSQLALLANHCSAINS